MPAPQKLEQALARAVLELPADKRPAFLDAACAGDSAFRARLEELIAAHERPDRPGPPPSPQRAPAGTIKLELPDLPGEAIGKTIGPYKLLERVGEGGFGVVYVAEQREPVKRRVALKIIKLGMDTRQVVARFEAERQALAMMDHPNIAKVLDAGATDTGRPYFAMELVRGISITRYCDQEKINTRQRIELFVKICQAIQHAHQKGVIHRDIKPSNILVTMHDGVPVPKVIDFGIAKATQQDLTDKTLYTQLQQFIGTPAYMSPEQAEMSGLDIDTRSDIYSLGVLLYELLTGRTPFDPKELMKEGVEGMRRAIREKEPVRPSTKVATLQGEELTTTAARQAVEAPKLISLLRGDLDWIVMKCLEKDRTRRYETANGLGMDLRRHLDNEPVLARPPSKLYRFQKAIGRNKLAFVAAGAVALVLLVGIVAATWQAVRASRAEALALQSRNDSEKLSNFILDDFYTVLEPSGQYETVARLAKQSIAYYDNLPPTLRTSDTARNRAIAQARLALVAAHQGEGKTALPMAQEAATTLDRMRQRGDHAEGTVFALGLALEAQFYCYREQIDLQSEAATLQRGVEVLRPLAQSADGSRRVKLEYANLMNNLSHFRRMDQAIETCDEALRIMAGLGALELSDLSAAAAWADLADSEARVAVEMGRLDDAERLEKKVQAVTEGVLAQRPGDLRARLNLFFAPDVLGMVEARRFHDADALRLANQSRQAAEEYIRFNPSDTHGWTLLSQAHFNILALMFREGRVADAMQQAVAALQIDRDPRNKFGALTPRISQLVARWEAQRGNRTAADQSIREARSSYLAYANRNRVSESTRSFLDRIDDAERQVRLAFGEDATVYAMATKELPHLENLKEHIAAPIAAAAVSFLRRKALSQEAQAALNLARYADAETAARALLSPDPMAEITSDRLSLDQPEDAGWGQVLLAQAALGQGRNAEALKTIESAIAHYRDMQTQGAAYVTFRQHFARALYVKALAETHDRAGAARARESLDQALALLQSLTDEAKQLHDSKELFSWIAAEKEKGFTH